MLQRREKSSPRWSPAEDNRPPHYVGLTSCESPVLYPPSSIFHPQYLVLPKAIEVMDRTVTRAHRKTPSNGLSDIFFGQGNSVLNLFSFGKVRSNGSGKSTASAMSVTSAYAGRAKRTDFFSIEEQVDGRSFSMTALDDDAFCTHRDNPTRGLFYFFGPGQFHSGQLLGFGKIRRHNLRHRDEMGAKCLNRILSQQQVARFCDHHRINHEILQVISANLRGDELDQRSIGEHPGLQRVRSDVLHNRIDLGGHQIDAQFQNCTDFDSILGGDCGDHRSSVDPEGGERLEIGLYSSTGTGIGAGDRENLTNRLHLVSEHQDIRCRSIMAERGCDWAQWLRARGCPIRPSVRKAVPHRRRVQESRQTCRRSFLGRGPAYEILLDPDR